MNDPIADFAALFLESNFSEDNKDYFLSQYYGGNIPRNIRERIMCYEILCDCLWAQWTVIKEAKGDNFGTYGMDRYKRACTNLKKLLG
jgi:thiamine kinase-like enzyme